MPTLPPVVVELKASLSELKAGLNEAGTELDKLEKHSASTGEKVRAALGKGLMIGGTAATAIGGALLEVSEKVEQSQKQLEVAIQNAGGSYDEYKKQIDQTVTSQEKLGHGAADTKEALAKLTTATQSPTQAMKDMAVAADIAAFKHISLSDAATLVDKVHAGSTKALKEFGISVTSAATASKDAAKAHKQLAADQQALTKATDTEAKTRQHVIDVLDIQHAKSKLTIQDTIQLRSANEAHTIAVQNVSAAHAKLAEQLKLVGIAGKGAVDPLTLIEKRIGGTAAAQADTFGGRLQALKVHVEDLAAAYGKQLGPALTVAGPLLMGVGAIIESSVVPAIVSATVAAAPWILAIAAIGVAAYEIYTHWGAIWGGIKQVFGDTWHFMYDTVTGVWDGMKAVFDKVVNGLGPISDAIHVLADLWKTEWDIMLAALKIGWDLIVGAFKVYRDVFVTAFKVLTDLFTGQWGKAWDDIKSGVGKIFGDLGGAIGKAFHDMLGGLGAIGDDLLQWGKDLGKAIIDGIVAFIQDSPHLIGDAIKALPGGNVIADAASHLPGVGSFFKATGGPVSAGAAYMVGERGPEMFVPDQSGTIVPNGGGGGGGPTYLVLDGQLVGRLMQNRLVAQSRNNTSLWPTTSVGVGLSS